jgi:prepilin-type N-terminal cleavage/methylation domain-containing protein
MSKKQLAINKKQGTKSFTLIETLIVVAIFGLVVAAGSFLINGVRNRLSLEDAQATVLIALEKARNQSATGFGTGGADYGIYVDITNNKLYSFETPYPTNAKEISLPPNVTIIEPAADTKIIFNRLSATSSVDATIRIKHDISGEEKTVVVTLDGIIEK